ncbi:hypothetical protein EH228_17170 [Erwinia endophytica]|nr:hypothetical protein EH228_17170 [Erwinia endophytica]
MTDFGGKACVFSHPVYLSLKEFNLQDYRDGSHRQETRMADPPFVMTLSPAQHRRSRHCPGFFVSDKISADVIIEKGIILRVLPARLPHRGAKDARKVAIYEHFLRLVVV